MRSVSAGMIVPLVFSATLALGADVASDSADATAASALELLETLAGQDSPSTDSATEPPTSAAAEPDAQPDDQATPAILSAPPAEPASERPATELSAPAPDGVDAPDDQPEDDTP
ncbi:MAG: hypothetical protein M0T70_15550 [Geobacteraceae bacterium]|nr:hypothetical protein [Geobacteraceae bacterium]